MNREETSAGDLLREESCTNHSNLEHLARFGVCGKDFTFLRQHLDVFRAVARLVRFCSTNSTANEALIEKINSIIEPETGRKINLQLCLLLLELNDWQVTACREEFSIHLQALKVCPLVNIVIRCRLKEAVPMSFKTGGHYGDCEVIIDSLNKKTKHNFVDAVGLSNILKEPDKYL